MGYSGTAAVTRDAVTTHVGDSGPRTAALGCGRRARGCGCLKNQLKGKKNPPKTAQGAHAGRATAPCPAWWVALGSGRVLPLCHRCHCTQRGAPRPIVPLHFSPARAVIIIISKLQRLARGPLREGGCCRHCGGGEAEPLGASREGKGGSREESPRVGGTPTARSCPSPRAAPRVPPPGPAEPHRSGGSRGAGRRRQSRTGAIFAPPPPPPPALIPGENPPPRLGCASAAALRSALHCGAAATRMLPPAALPRAGRRPLPSRAQPSRAEPNRAEPCPAPQRRAVGGPPRTGRGM